MTPIIRPSYRRNQLTGFQLMVFNRYLNSYEAVGRAFAQYKHAALVWRECLAIQNEDSHSEETK
jgi:hypothetical protein